MQMMVDPIAGMETDIYDAWRFERDYFYDARHAWRRLETGKGALFENAGRRIHVKKRFCYW